MHRAIQGRAVAASIFDLFDGERRYEVPLFQRQYVWNLEDHWEPLWEDIERKFVQRLNGMPSTPHFLGAMVIDQRRLYGNAVPVQLVIDGQQAPDDLSDIPLSFSGCLLR